MSAFYKIITFPIAFLLFHSCSETNDKQNYPEQNISEGSRIRNGKVIHSVPCVNNPLETYSLYIPSGYDKTKNWPVIYIFDPHAKGDTPVTKYKDLAEEFGYILVGSDYSKNGLPWNKTISHISNVMMGVNKDISIDSRRVYAMGFSGGARVAAAIGISEGGITGVIACGAGFPKTDRQKMKQKFDFIGLVGYADFNYPEMIQSDDELEQNGFRHHLLAFDGKHEWPKPEILKEALIWFELNAMRDRLIEKNENIINIRLSEEKEKGLAIEKTNDLIALYQHYKKVIEFYKDLADLNEVKNKLSEIENSKKFKNLIETRTMVMIEEDQLKSFYTNAFTSQDIAWWEKEAEKIRSFNCLGNSSDDENDIYLKQSNKRVIAYLGVVGYMYCSQAIETNRLGEAEKFIVIYEILEPENYEHAYLLAALYTKQNKIMQALDALEHAFELGFDDINRLMNDNYLRPLQREQKFRELLDRQKV